MLNVIIVVLKILLVLISVGLTIVVLMQEGKEGGLGAVMGGGAGASYVSQNENRTPEGKKRMITRILGIAFMVIALVLNVLAKLAA